MAAFTDLDWRRLDDWAIVQAGGLATIELHRHARATRWLRDQGYVITTLDCGHGLGRAVVGLGRIFDWESQFGYALSSDRCNLDAIRDGFHFEVAANGRRVFEINRPDLTWRDDPAWLLGLLSIIREHSREELALGRRFFALLVLPDGSPLIGASIEDAKVPCPFWNPCTPIDEFDIDPQ